MKKLSFLIILIAFNATLAQAQAASSIEEKLTLKAFLNYEAALQYDEACNNNAPKTRYDFDKKENVLRQGNEQMLASRMGLLFQNRTPNITVDQGVKKLTDISKNSGTHIAKLLKEKGCNSPEGQLAKKSLQLYTTVHPQLIHSMLDKEIIKQGGNITPPKDNTDKKQ